MSASRTRAVATACLAGFFLFGCTPRSTAVDADQRPSPPADWGGPEGEVRIIPPLPHPAPHWERPPDEGEPVLEFRLREAERRPVADRPPARSDGAPLSEAEAATLLRALPSLPADTGAAVRLPVRSPPPPRTGATVLATFPAPESVTVIRPGVEDPLEEPLTVVRITPSGETATVPHVVVVFSRPMVPLSSLGVVHAGDVPVRLTPQPPGRWSWVDPRTLRFEPEQRLPMATRYEVEVRAGARPMTGAPLAETVSAEFTTSPAMAVGAYPASHPIPERGAPPHLRRPLPDGVGLAVTGRRPVILIVFDQEIAPEAVLRHARLEAAGAAYPLRLATPAEVRADSIVRPLSESATPGRWVAVRPAGELPANAEVRLRLAAGLPSAEGPLTAIIPQELRFRTFGPLRVERHGCGYSEGEECPPGAPWTFTFSNPLDPRLWSDSLVQIVPEVESFRSQIYGQTLQILARTRPNTTYRVRLHASVRDVFGQALGPGAEFTFRTGPAPPALGLFGAPMIVLDPAGPRSLTLQSRGHPELRVQLYQVRPEDFPAFTAEIQRLYQAPEGRSFRAPGRRVMDMVVRPDDRVGFSLVNVDLGPALGESFGHAIVVVEPTRVSDEVAQPGIRTRPVPGHSRVAPVFAWVQATEIGLAAMVDQEELLGWATSLRTGEPLAGVELTLLGGRGSVRTGPDGTAVLPLGERPASVLLARRGEDSALLPEHVHGWDQGSWRRQASEAPLRWLVLTDRGLYRPGEEVHLKGWIRQMEPGKRGDLVLPAGLARVDYTARGSRGEEIRGGRAEPGRLGGFHSTFTIPEETNLGHVGIQLEAQGPQLPQHARQWWHQLNVQEFRRPEYEVSATTGAGPHVVGDTVRITARAAYYAGGGLLDAQVQWTVQAMPADYTPPGWTGWSFGRGMRWWGGRTASMRPQTLTGTTDAGGEHHVRVDLIRAEPPFATSLSATVNVQDVNRQVGSRQMNVLVHPAELYVGLRSSRGWVSVGDSMNIEVVATDIDGRLREGREVMLSIEPVRWGFPLRAGARADEDAPSPTPLCRVRSGTAPVGCVWKPAAPGAFVVAAEVRDDAGRVSRTELTLWVGGGGRLTLPFPMPDAHPVTLLPDRPEYQPGDVAEVLVQAPFSPAEGLLTLRRVGVIHTERFRVEGGSHTLRIPVSEAHLPNVQLRVDLVGGVDGTLHAAGEAELNVPPRRRELTVALTPRDSVTRPGARSSVEIEVRTANGGPAAGAEVTLWVVDESLLSLSGYTVPDPLEAFYPRLYHGVRDHGMRGWVVQAPRSAGPGTVSGQLFGAEDGMPQAGVTVTVEGTTVSTVSGANGAFTLRGVPAGERVLLIHGPMGIERRAVTVPAGGVHLGPILLGGMHGGRVEALQEAQAAPAPPPPPGAPAAEAGRGVALDAMAVTGAQRLAGRGGAPADDPLLPRTQLTPLAVFEPAIRTDTNGRARVEFQLPESLTRYRVMAVAVEGARRFGRGEALITTRSDLMVRPSAPRFLNFGDTAEIPVVVQNLTAEALEVSVAARGAGITLPENAGRRVVIPAGDRVEVRFPATASAAGTARLQVVARSGARSDAAEISFPVYTPATAEAFALYGDIADGRPVVIPVSPPGGVLESFGGLEITLSSTAVQELTDALLYLHAYPFEGVEQTASRLLATAALREVLSAFAAEGLPNADSIEAATRRDIRRLAELQRHDGGWSYWRVDHPSDPFVSAHATHALQRAREKGYALPPGVLERALEFLRRSEAEVRAAPRVAEAISAYALYVRSRSGDADAVREARRRAVAAAAEPFARQPTLETLGWLLHAISGEPGSGAEVASLLRQIRNRATETAATATFASRYDEGEHLILHSDRRSDAVVLEALISADPRSDLIPKTARGLLGHRVRGRWGSTQENAWVLLALERYFQEYERQTPNFRSSAWWGERLAGTREFRGRTTERFHVEIPMRHVLAPGQTTDLTLSRQGEGRMYYRAGLRYAPADLMLPALDRGFRVERVYEAVDDPADVVRDGDGWTIRAGARVRVRLTLVAPSRRHHVALMDPLPAGLEPLNPELRGTGAEPLPPERGAEPRRMFPPPFWFVHQNLRDDRVEAFATLLSAGSYEYTYLARATTPGSFVAPPPRAEEMYQPETFGRGAASRVRVR